MSLFGGLVSITGITFLMFIIFIIVAAGYALGHISIKGVSLGTAGVFVMALIVGAIFFKAGETPDVLQTVIYSTTFSKSFLKIIENLGLMLFVTSVGFIAGPNFFSSLKKNFKSYALLSLIIIILGGLTALVCIKVFGCGTAMAVGILSGALTSTPAFSSAKDTLSSVYGESSSFITDYVAQNGGDAAEVSKNVISQFEDIVTVGHGIAYLFGVVGVVLFVQIIPKVLKADVVEERKKISAIDTGAAKENTRKLVNMDSFGLCAFGLALVVGILVGGIKIPLGASTFSLGTTGGCLLSSLVIAHFGHFGPMNMRPEKRVLEVFREFGLMCFLIGAGIPGGASFVQYFHASYFFYGALMTLIPMIVGFIVASKVMKLPLFNNLGGITGGMTSTPALGTLISVAGTDDVANAYAAAYPIALIAVVLVSQFLITIFPDGLNVVGL
ncbi:MAG: permease [Oscillospiraceae bacterium]|nr:permease [Oscillospiraceae bacterium]